MPSEVGAQAESLLIQIGELTTLSKLVRLDAICAASNHLPEDIMLALLCLIRDGSLMSIEDANSHSFLWITDRGRHRLLAQSFDFSEHCGETRTRPAVTSAGGAA